MAAAATFDVVKALTQHRTAITTLSSKLKLKSEPRLVAVSKTKPISLISLAYANGQRHFGENYVAELVGKAALLKSSCPDVRWHFIGHLQSNKCKQLLAGTVPNLHVVETVDSIKLASSLNRACDAVKMPASDRLKVMVQVNTSGEASKFGCEPSECVTLAKHVWNECKRLELIGLMTIGRPVVAATASPTADFDSLAALRASVAKELKIDASSLELSMGMSHDFETAIQSGSTNVRVGSAIFGDRDYSKEVEAQIAANSTATAAPTAAAATATAADATKPALPTATATATAAAAKPNSAAAAPPAAS